jgi:hypothetical protein
MTPRKRRGSDPRTVKAVTYTCRNFDYRTTGCPMIQPSGSESASSTYYLRESRYGKVIGRRHAYRNTKTCPQSAHCWRLEALHGVARDEVGAELTRTG